MPRLLTALGLALLLGMSLAMVANAGSGNAYGNRIYACTSMSYGQLKNVAKANDREATIRR